MLLESERFDERETQADVVGPVLIVDQAFAVAGKPLEVPAQSLGVSEMEAFVLALVGGIAWMAMGVAAVDGEARHATGEGVARLTASFVPVWRSVEKHIGLPNHAKSCGKPPGGIAEWRVLDIE